MKTSVAILWMAALSGALFFYTSTASALKASGYVNAVYDRAIGPIPEGYTVDSQIDMEGRLKLKSKMTHHLQGVFAIDAAAYEREVIPSRLYVDYKPNKTWRLRIGYAKKIVGLSYEQDKEEQLTIHRSEVYQKMDSSGLVGRQFAIALRLRTGKQRHNTWSLALSHDGSRNSNVTYSAIHRFSSSSNLRAGVWGIIEMRRFKAVGSLTVFANAMALWYQSPAARFAFEIIHGIDPDATHYEMLFRKSRKVHFVGPRVEAAYRYRLTDSVALQPLVQASMLFGDLQYARGNTLQFLAGLNLLIHELVFSVNVETIGKGAPKDVGTRRYERKSLYAEIAYYF